MKNLDKKSDKKSDDKTLLVVKEIVWKEIERGEGIWPPQCIGILHQPKRPTSK